MGASPVAWASPSRAPPFELKQWIPIPDWTLADGGTQALPFDTNQWAVVGFVATLQAALAEVGREPRGDAPGYAPAGPLGLRCALRAFTAPRLSPKVLLSEADQGPVVGPGADGRQKRGRDIMSR